MTIDNLNVLCHIVPLFFCAANRVCKQLFTAYYNGFMVLHLYWIILNDSYIVCIYDKLDSETIHACFLLLCKMKLHRNKNFSSIIMLTNCNLHTFLLSKHLGKCLHTRLFHSTCTSICDCDQ